MKPVVHLTIKKTHPDFRELGFVCEYQAFVDGKPLDDVQLSKDQPTLVAASYAKEYEVVYVNGVRATPGQEDSQ